MHARNMGQFAQKKFGKLSLGFGKLSFGKLGFGKLGIYPRSSSPSQRPAPTTIASRSPFPLGLCSCSDFERFGKRRFGKRRFGKRRFGKRRFGKNMAADVSAKRWRRFLCRNVSYDMWGISGVCALALTVAKISSHYDRFAISVPARSLLLFDLA